MPDASPAVSTATPAPTPQTPAAPAKPTTVSVLEKVRAKADFGIDPKPEPKPEAAPSPAKVEIPAADAAALKRAAQLEKVTREQEARIKQLESESASFATAKEALELWKAGKKLEALTKLSGNEDATAEYEALTEAYLAGTDPKQGAENALEEKVEKLAEELEADRKARADLEKKQAEQAAAERLANAHSFALKTLDDIKHDNGEPVFELCAHPDNRADAAKLATEHAGDLAIARQLDPETITPEIAAQLYRDAFAAVEAELEAEGERRRQELARFTKKPKSAPESKQSQAPQRVSPPATREDTGKHTTPQTRPLARPPVQTTPTKPAHTISAVLEKVRERARY